MRRCAGYVDTNATVVKKTNPFKKLEWVSKCGELGEVTITIPYDIWVAVRSLCNKYEGKEWGGVFDVDDKGVVSNLRIPEQEVTSSSVDFDEDLPANGCIHSHGSMGAFWSATDDASFRNVYEWSIVVNDKLDYKACRKVMLPCGKLGYNEGVIEVLYEGNTDAILKEAADKVRDRVPKVVTYTPPAHLVDRQRNLDSWVNQQSMQHKSKVVTLDGVIMYVDSINSKYPYWDREVLGYVNIKWDFTLKCWVEAIDCKLEPLESSKEEDDLLLPCDSCTEETCLGADCTMWANISASGDVVLIDAMEEAVDQRMAEEDELHRQKIQAEADLQLQEWNRSFGVT